MEKIFCIRVEMGCARGHIEKLPPIKRNELSENAYDDFVKSVITMNTEYSWTVEDIKAELFHPKGITEPEEAFAFMDKLIPSRENAFLFDKRLSGLPF